MKFRELWDRYTTTSIRSGIIRTFNIDETLDSMTVVLTHIDEISIEPYDIVELTNESNVKEYWCVANYNAAMVSKNPISYDYTVDLVELTKLLETIYLPSMAITPLGTRKFNQYIQRVFMHYFKNDYNLSFRVQNMSNMFTQIAPCTFSEPTLREYIDYLMSFDNQRSELHFVYENNQLIFELGYKSLNPYNSSSFPTQYVDDIRFSQSADDYVSTLVTEAKEVVSPNEIVEVHKLSSTGLLFDSNTAEINLHYKPYDISKIEVLGTSGNINDVYRVNSDDFKVVSRYEPTSSDPNPSWVDKSGLVVFVHPFAGYVGTYYDFAKNQLDIYCNGLDITKYLVTSNIYTSRETLKQGEIINHVLDDNVYRNNAIYWQRGSKTISGLHTYESKKVVFTSNDKPAIEMAMVFAAISTYRIPYTNPISSLSNYNILLASTTYEEEGEEGTTNTRIIYVFARPYHSGSAYSISSSYEYTEAKFRITYTPYMNMKFKQKETSRHYVEMGDSSTNAMTDIKTFYNTQKLKNKQLGNQTKIFTGHSLPSQGIVFSIGMKYGDYVLNTLEYERKQNIILYKGTLTKNYANRNVQTVLNREKRYYSLPDETEMIIRHEYFDSNAMHQMHSSFFTSNNIVCFVFTSNDVCVGSVPVNRVKLSNTEYEFIFTMKDNAVVGTKISSSLITTNGSKYAQMTNVFYTDSNGESTFLKFRLVVVSEFVFIANGDYSRIFYNTDDIDSDHYYDIVLGNDGYWLKDGRECIAFTLYMHS